MVTNHCYFGSWIAFFSLLLLVAAVSSKTHVNPANDLVDIINKNRTAQKVPQLTNNPGLGCMALQYAEQCKGNCTINNTLNCHPRENDFTQIFAPNCGVELPTFGSITAYIIACQHKYLTPLEAYKRVLVKDKKTMSIFGNRTDTEVGVGLIGTHKHKGPYFWCILFSNSARNTTFVLEDLGEGIKQKKGCYSGKSIGCSGVEKNSVMFFSKIWILGFVFLHFSQYLEWS